MDDKTDIFTSRWEETHLYMIDLMWVCFSCGTETTSRDFYSSEVRKTLEKTEKLFAAKFLEGAVAVTTAVVPSSAARSLDLFGERWLVFFVSDCQKEMPTKSGRKEMVLPLRMNGRRSIHIYRIYLLTYDII